MSSSLVSRIFDGLCVLTGLFVMVAVLLLVRRALSTWSHRSKPGQRDVRADDKQSHATVCRIAPVESMAPPSCEAVLSASHGRNRKVRKPLFCLAVRGAIMAISTSAFAAILATYTIGFPVPLGGVMGPFGRINPYAHDVRGIVTAVMFGWTMYGMYGGFIVLGMLGGIAGVWMGREYSESRNKDKLIVFWSAMAGAVPTFAV